MAEQQSESRSTRSAALSSYGPTKASSRSRATHSGSRPRTNATSTGYWDNEIICAISESRGISPVIGLSFVNLSTSEAVLCQFADTQTFARTCHKIKVFSPSEILYMSTASESKLLSIIQENLEVEKYEILMTSIDRRYWSESTGHEYVHHLAFPDDLESLKLSMGGNYFAACCFAAALRYIELGLAKTFAAQSLRIKFESSEGSMMIDISTIASLELIQNLQNAKSKDCLFGLLNETLTQMGARFLRSNILQPCTDRTKIQDRYDALEELTTKEDMFFAVRGALKSFVDTDRVLASLVILPTKINFQFSEQSINNVLMLKAFVDSIKAVWQALAGASSEELQKIRQFCANENYEEVELLIRATLNEDVTYSSQPVELRNQRVYAVKAGVNDFLDIARQTYKEANEDAFNLVTELNDQHDIALDLRFEPARQFYIRISVSELENKTPPPIFINIFRRKNMIECQTLGLVKVNQRITDAHNEVVNNSDKSVQDLIDNVRSKVHPLFKISESIATLDMIASFAQLVTTQSYVKPDLTATLAIKAGRHPIREKIHQDKFVPNDVYATLQKRFQIITGCNMSGKSTYIRSISLMTIIAQVGCFVPADYASFPIIHKLFARVSTDDSIEANISSFASEMREMAFILHNIEPRSLVIVDELGRGTSTTDGLAIAIAIAEALIESKAFVYFVTHFRELPRILAERSGVVNLHLAVDITADYSKMKMRYKIADGYEEEKFYGLALAKVMNLPDDVLELATKVSKSLNERNEARKSKPTVLAVFQRRKLILNLREQLIQAKDGDMESATLRDWCVRLQNEFIVRMKAIDEKLVATGCDTERAINEERDGHEIGKTYELESHDTDEVGELKGMTGSKRNELHRFGERFNFSSSHKSQTRGAVETSQRQIKIEGQVYFRDPTSDAAQED